MRRHNSRCRACANRYFTDHDTKKSYKVVTSHGVGASRISSVKQPGRRYGPAPVIKLSV